MKTSDQVLWEFCKRNEINLIRMLEIKMVEVILNCKWFDQNSEPIIFKRSFLQNIYIYICVCVCVCVCIYISRNTYSRGILRTVDFLLCVYIFVCVCVCIKGRRFGIG